MENYAGIIWDDIANGTGFGAVFFIQGCPHHCPGCHNSHTWDFDGGNKLSTETVKKILQYYEENPFATRLSISGGEPLYDGTRTLWLSMKFKDKFPDYKIWLWTGYRFEDLTDQQKGVLKFVDVLIDGPFIETEKDLTLAFRGSKNQRILDCQKSIRQNQAVLYKE